MSRSSRHVPGGMIYHVLNRANGGSRLFTKDEDYRALLRIVSEALLVAPMRILAYCLMPTHWHFVLWPERDGQLPAFMHQLTNTHMRRWHEHRRSVGRGHVYQGPYKSFPVEDCRAVDRNLNPPRILRHPGNFPSYPSSRNKGTTPVFSPRFLAQYPPR